MCKIPCHKRFVLVVVYIQKWNSHFTTTCNVRENLLVIKLVTCICLFCLCAVLGISRVYCWICVFVHFHIPHVSEFFTQSFCNKLFYEQVWIICFLRTGILLQNVDISKSHCNEVHDNFCRYSLHSQCSSKQISWTR